MVEYGAAHEWVLNWETFVELRDKVVVPYMQKKGLELPELLFSRRENEFLITDASGSEAKELIRITYPPRPENVEVISKDYEDLGELLKEELEGLNEQIARLYGTNDISKGMD